MLNSGSPRLTVSANRRVRSARTFGRIQALLPIEAGIRLVSVDSSPNPPALVESYLSLLVRLQYRQRIGAPLMTKWLCPRCAR